MIRLHSIASQHLPIQIPEVLEERELDEVKHDCIQQYKRVTVEGIHFGEFA